MYLISASHATRVRRAGLLWQIGIATALCSAAVLIAQQTSANLRMRGIASGYDYLRRAAGFELPAGPVPFSSSATFARALAAGLVNTARMAGLAIVAAAAIGVVTGIARLSSVKAIAGAARVYVNTVRNVPLLLQILCWAALLQRLPDATSAWRPLRGISLSNRGLTMFTAGVAVTPEFAALFAALSIYTAAFISENVRGGIESVPRGQAEAAAALGLTRLDVLRRILLPQALPVIVPPTIGQFVSLTKNSSLAAAIGYPDLMSVTTTTINQTGQAIEAFALAMAIYLAINLAISAMARRRFRLEDAA